MVSSPTLAAHLSNDKAQAALVYCYVKEGKHAQAKAAFDKLLDRSQTEYIPKSSLAAAASFLGQKELAHELLKKAFDEHDSYLVRLLIYTVPLQNDLISDPRNVRLFEELNLPRR